MNEEFFPSSGIHELVHSFEMVAIISHEYHHNDKFLPLSYDFNVNLSFPGFVLDTVSFLLSGQGGRIGSVESFPSSSNLLLILYSVPISLCAIVLELEISFLWKRKMSRCFLRPLKCTVVTFRNCILQYIYSTRYTSQEPKYKMFYSSCFLVLYFHESSFKNSKISFCHLSQAVSSIFLFFVYSCHVVSNRSFCVKMRVFSLFWKVARKSSWLKQDPSSSSQQVWWGWWCLGTEKKERKGCINVNGQPWEHFKQSSTRSVDRKYSRTRISCWLFFPRKWRV